MYRDQVRECPPMRSSQSSDRCCAFDKPAIQNTIHRLSVLSRPGQRLSAATAATKQEEDSFKEYAMSWGSRQDDVFANQLRVVRPKMLKSLFCGSGIW